MLEHAGQIELTAKNLINHVSLPRHHGSRFWLGPRNGDTYTTNCVTPGVLIVSYFGAHQSLGSGSIPFLKISAYETRAIFDQQLHPTEVNSVASTSNFRGDVLTYEESSLDKLTVKRDHSQEVITIEYSTPQTVPSMVQDSENLMAITKNTVL